MTIKKKLHILQHALGRDEYGDSKSKRNGGEDYRNHYVASPGHDSWDTLEAMTADGLVLKHAPRDIFGGDDCHCFTVTPAGIDFVALNSPKRPKVPRSKARYMRYLEYGDGFDSFLHYCKWDAHPGRSWNGGAA